MAARAGARVDVRCSAPEEAISFSTGMDSRSPNTADRAGISATADGTRSLARGAYETMRCCRTVGMFSWPSAASNADCHVSTDTTRDEPLTFVAIPLISVAIFAVGLTDGQKGREDREVVKKRRLEWHT
jgi:hypothetical protein